MVSSNPGDWGSIPGQIILKTQKKEKWHLMPLFLTRHYKVRIKGKCSNAGKGVAPSSTPRFRSY